MVIMKTVGLLTATTASLLLITGAAEAGLGQKEGVSITHTIYLGDGETGALSEELSKKRFFDETFTLVFKCDRYKRTPDAKNRTLNCLAVSAISESDEPTPKEKSKR
jgi:hypothetical protein